MDGTKKNIDGARRDSKIRKQAELLAIGQEIVSSVMPIVVIFVDFGRIDGDGSRIASRKIGLGYVFEFIQRVDQRARDADGTVVKRIGDQLRGTARV